MAPLEFDGDSQKRFGCMTLLAARDENVIQPTGEGENDENRPVMSR
jgi:hypothetical protein